MTAIGIVAYGAIDALGEGEVALGLADVAVTAVRRDPELAEAGLERPFVARVAIETERDRAAVLFERALASCAARLDQEIPGWRGLRVGLAIGTSSGGMRSLGHGFDGTYLAPVLAASRPCDLEPFALVLGACASGSLAVGLARAWLLADKCDVALAGGFDAVSPFVASGFEALRATAGERGPRPFRIDRDGLSLGEGAAVIALMRGRGDTFVTGFGASCDAVHLTAPDRTGSGLARAIEHAIAGAPPIDLVSAHGTATVFNDAAETKALEAVFGERARKIPIHAFKGVIGHTLGAAGALELLATSRALLRGLALPSAGGGPIEGGLRVLDRAEPMEARAALKLSSAFGGANVALVLEHEPPVRIAPARRAVYVSRAFFVADDALASRSGYAEDRIARADLLVRLALAATASLAEHRMVRGAGIIVGHGLATLDTNRLYLARLRAGRGEPRRFPYTSPNAAAGECAVAFGLTGPAFAVGGGSHGGLEALACAADLVAGGVADRIVVVAVDEAGEASRAIAPDTPCGAVALLVGAEPDEARLASWTTRLEARAAPAPARTIAAHPALLPLAQGRPERLDVDGRASATLIWR